MPAPKGNNNAKGNRGGKGAPSVTDRVLATDVRRLALTEIKTILLEKEMTPLKHQVILKLAPSLLPRLNEHTGQDGKDLFPVPILSNMNVPSNNSNQKGSEPS